MNKFCYVLLINCFAQLGAAQPVQIQVDVLANRKPVSPYLYGRNNALSANPATPVTAANWLRYKEAGLRFLRENGGNNAAKYNWRRKLSSHPDWYNNVYTNNWDFAAASLLNNLPGTQGMWAFQLLGKAAKTNAGNFNDWGYNQSKWWQGVNQNLAGGGTVNSDLNSTKALKEGNPDQYLENWPADSTVGILDHWFGAKGLGFDKSRIRYWSMDNEAEIWSGTHDDVMAVQLPAEDFIQRYVAVALKARAKDPAIKLVGPATANEWQWYNYDNKPVTGADGKKYPWLEFFIKRIAEEQKRTGVRLLDVLDIHFYPGSSKSAEVVQMHRVFFDRTYVFPEANGVRTSTGGWDTSLNKEYIMGRCRDWLTQYMGATHGMGLGLSEVGLNSANDANTHAVWYASTLGEFMNNQVELFTPWSWQPGMWEVLHLFSRYNLGISVDAISTNEELVSAYATTNQTNDSLTVALVNRSANETKTVTLTIKNGSFPNQNPAFLLLANLPATETFVSRTANALKRNVGTLTNNTLTVSVPPMSVGSLQLVGQPTSSAVVTGLEPTPQPEVVIFPNPSQQSFQLTTTSRSICTVYDIRGRVVQSFATPTSQSFGHDWPAGAYVAVLTINGQPEQAFRLVKQ